MRVGIIIINYRSDNKDLFFLAKYSDEFLWRSVKSIIYINAKYR